FFSVVPQMRAAQRRITQGAVPQASVDPRQVRLPVIDGTDIRFARLSTADGLSQTKVAQIVQDDQGFMWFGTQYGLHRYDGNDVKSSGEDKGGRFWVANTEGLDEFDRRTGKVTLHIPCHEPSSVLSFYEDRFGVFWIFRSGLAVFDRKTNTLTHYSFHEVESL